MGTPMFNPEIVNTNRLLDKLELRNRIRPVDGIKIHKQSAANQNKNSQYKNKSQTGPKGPKTVRN